MPIIRQVRYRTVPGGKDERTYREMASGMEVAGEGALIIDVTKVELNVLDFYRNITHLTIRADGRKFEVNGLPPSVVDLCLLDIDVDDRESVASLPDLRVFDCRKCTVRQLEALKKCRGLKVLHLLSIPNLRHLDFVFCLEHLEWVKIVECMNLTRFPQLGNLHSLRRVVLERCQGLTDLTAFSSAPKLDDLILLEAERLTPRDFERLVPYEHPKHVLPGIGSLDSPDFAEASTILGSRTIRSYYGGKNEFLEVFYRGGDREFVVKVS